MLKIKDDVDLKELENYGFTGYIREYSRKYNNDIITCIDKETREIRDIDTDYKFLMMKDLGESKRVNDLIKDGLVEKVKDEYMDTIDIKIPIEAPKEKSSTLSFEQLQQRIDKAIEITNKILMNNADNRMICNEEEKEYFDWLDSEMLKQEKILKGSDSNE